MARAGVSGGRRQRHSQPVAQQPGRHTQTRTAQPAPARPPARGGGGGGPGRAGRRGAGPRGALGRRAGGGGGARGPVWSAPILRAGLPARGEREAPSGPQTAAGAWGAGGGAGSSAARR